MGDSLDKLIPENSSEYSAPARLEGHAWKLMEAIMKGEYASKIKRGALNPIIPTTQSPMSRPKNAIILHLQQVYDGKMALAGLNNAAEKYKAFALGQEMIRFAVTSQPNQPCSQEVLENTSHLLHPASSSSSLCLQSG